jgi:acyl-CoA thioester hydrolase
MPASHPTLEQILQLPENHRVVIPEEYIDEYGHVNVRYYGVMWGGGAGTLMRGIGIDDNYRNERRMGHWLLRQVLDYLAEVHAGDTVTVHGRIVGRNENRMHNEYWMVNHTKGKIAAASEVLVANADLDARKMAPFPEDIAANLDAAIARFNELDWAPNVSGAILL